VTAVKLGIGGIHANFEDAIGEIAHMERVIERYPDHFLQVRKHSDFDRARRERKLRMIFSFARLQREYSTAFVGKVIGANFYRAFREIWGTS
jgi:microsomal dipeptidase-like Zn-dependent dipeptidase